MKNSARRPPPNRHGPLEKLAEGCEGCPMMANRSDRRFPNLPGVQAPRDRWSDMEKTRGCPSWPGAIVAPSKGRIHPRAFRGLELRVIATAARSSAVWTLRFKELSNIESLN